MLWAGHTQENMYSRYRERRQTTHSHDRPGKHRTRDEVPLPATGGGGMQHGGDGVHRFVLDGCLRLPGAEGYQQGADTARVVEVDDREEERQVRRSHDGQDVPGGFLQTQLRTAQTHQRAPITDKEVGEDHTDDDGCEKLDTQPGIH